MLPRVFESADQECIKIFSKKAVAEKMKNCMIFLIHFCAEEPSGGSNTAVVLHGKPSIFLFNQR